MNSPADIHDPAGHLGQQLAKRAGAKNGIRNVTGPGLTPGALAEVDHPQVAPVSNGQPPAA